MNLPRLFCVVLSGAVCLTTACGSDSPNGPATPGTGSLDIAAVLAEFGRGTPVGARSEMGISESVAAGAVVPSTCTHVAASQSFTCPTPADGMTIALSYMLLDAAGHPQSAPSVATTAAVRTMSMVKGLLGIPTPVNTIIVIDRTDDMTLGGLLTGAHTLNGTAQGTSVFKATNEPTIYWTSVEKSTITNVVLPKSGSALPWPVSGTITTDEGITTNDGSLSGLKTTVHTVMTFNGSATMVVTFTVDGASATCTIDLEHPSGLLNSMRSACLAGRLPNAVLAGTTTLATSLAP